MAQLRGIAGPQNVQHLSPEEAALLLGDAGLTQTLKENLGDKLAMGTKRSPHFLLAAHLSRWMDGIYEGASRSEVIGSWKSAHPGEAKLFAHVDGDFLELMQQVYTFMPAWSQKPADVKTESTAESWLDLPDQSDLFADRLGLALQKLSEVPLGLPLTKSVSKKLEQRQAFKGYNVVMVQHMLGQANPFIESMCAAGMEVDKAEYVGIPYQKNPAIQLTLDRTYGLDVTVGERGDIDGMWDNVCAAVDRAVEKHGQNGEPILLIDDGGYASKYIHQKYPEMADQFRVVEQTTRGLTEISKLDDPQFPIIDVAGSYGKRFESAQVGDAVVQAVRRVLHDVAKTPARKDVLIVGAGKVGEGVADAFAGDGSRVTIFDPFVTPMRAQHLEAQGYRVITDKAQALSDKFLVVGCSGHRSIEMEDFAKMSSPVFIASSSSKRVEIDIIGLQEQATTGGKLRRVLAARVNEQETWAYWLKDGTIVMAMNDTLPVNFQDVNSIEPELIDHTMALMLLAAGQATDSDTVGEKGLVELDPRDQFAVQAEMEGLHTLEPGEKPKAGELAIALGKTTYVGTKQRWRDIAASPATPPEVLEGVYNTLMDAGQFQHPLVLDVLQGQHELSDAIVDKVLDTGLLPHIARIANNPSLTAAQTDRVIGFCTKGWDEIHFSPGKGEVDWKIKAARARPDGKWDLWQCARQAPPDYGGGVKSLPLGTTENRDVVSAQLAEILLQHPRSPVGFRQYLMTQTYQTLSSPSAANVQMVRNPQWSTDALKTLLPEAMSAVYRCAQRTKDFTADYGYDVIDALRTHPNADLQIQNAAQDFLADYQSRIDDSQRGQNRTQLLGIAGWQPSPLGTPAPSYL